MNIQEPTFKLKFADKDKLFAAYMPFIKGGGLFIPTTKSYNLGDDVIISIKLPDDITEYTLIGKVIWMTPAAAQGGRPAGIGMQLGADEATAIIRNKIETILAGMLQSERISDTL